MVDPRVLVAEDDARQAEVLRRYLVDAGFAVSLAENGVEAVRLARTTEPDVVVLDVMMPGVDGLAVCREIRAVSDVPVLMLTARTTEADLVAGLDHGADDYVRKPYSPRELTARVRALLRRSAAGAVATGRSSSDETIFRIGSLAVEPTRHRATLDGEVLDCTPGEFAILAAMAQRPERVFTRAQLLAHTRGLDRSSTERTIDVHVMNLRRKLERDPSLGRMLRTVYGVGYRLGDAGTT